MATRGDDAAPADTRVPVTRIVPAAGQSFVTGEIDFLSADDTQTTPIPVPFTLTSVDRGTGKGTIENALVDGKRTTIFWGGGTPLPLSGEGGGVDVTGAVVEVAPGGLTWTISGGRKLLPGSYFAGAPVAVGATGLAASRDSVSFTADDRTVLNTTGGVAIELDPNGWRSPARDGCRPRASSPSPTRPAAAPPPPSTSPPAPTRSSSPPRAPSSSSTPPSRARLTAT